jgi:hypothetical protein
MHPVADIRRRQSKRLGLMESGWSDLSWTPIVRQPEPLLKV